MQDFDSDGNPLVRVPSWYQALRPVHAGPTIGDFKVHAISRSAFLDEYLRGPVYRGTRAAFSKALGLQPLADGLRSVLEQADQLPKLRRGPLRSGWSAPSTGLPWLARDRLATSEGSRGALLRVMRLSRMLNSEITSPTVQELMLSGFQRTVDLYGPPMPWLAADLRLIMLLDLWASAWGVRFSICYEARFPTLEQSLSPTITFRFAPVKGENVADAVARFDSEALRYRQQLQQPSPARRGRIPDKSTETLERNARWFYQDRVMHRSRRTLARESFDGNERHKDVRVGIERAEQILMLADM
jgi:hypothetical protein